MWRDITLSDRQRNLDQKFSMRKESPTGGKEISMSSPSIDVVGTHNNEFIAQANRENQTLRDSESARVKIPRLLKLRRAIGYIQDHLSDDRRQRRQLLE